MLFISMNCNCSACGGIAVYANCAELREPIHCAGIVDITVQPNDHVRAFWLYCCCAVSLEIFSNKNGSQKLQYALSFLIMTGKGASLQIKSASYTTHAV